MTYPLSEQDTDAVFSEYFRLHRRVVKAREHLQDCRRNEEEFVKKHAATLYASNVTEVDGVRVFNPPLGVPISWAAELAVAIVRDTGQPIMMPFNGRTFGVGQRRTVESIVREWEGN